MRYVTKRFNTSAPALTPMSVITRYDPPVQKFAHPRLPGELSAGALRQGPWAFGKRQARAAWEN